MQTSRTWQGNSEGKLNEQMSNKESVIQGYIPALYGWEIEIEGVTLLLGGWWLVTSEQGGLEMIPVVNLDPTMGLVTDTGDIDWEDKEHIDQVTVEEEMVFKQKLMQTRREEEEAVFNAQSQLEDISCDTHEVEEIMKKALVSMEKTRKIVESIDGIADILQQT